MNSPARRFFIIRFGSDQFKEISEGIFNVFYIFGKRNYFEAKVALSETS